MATLTRIEPVSLAKVFGVLYAVFGVFYGLMLWGFMSIFAASGGPGAAMMGNLPGVGLLIASPISFGIGGFIGGLIMAALYNVVAGWIGGVEVEVSSDDRVRELL